VLSTMMRGQGRTEKGEGRGNWISVLWFRGSWSWCLDGVLSCSCFVVVVGILFERYQFCRWLSL